MIPSSLGLTQDSIALLEQIRVIDKSRILKYLGTLTSSDMINIDRKIISFRYKQVLYMA